MIRPPSRTFEYLLNAMERAAQEANPYKHGYADKRTALLAYVRALELLAEARGRALEWYGDQACALARYMTDKPPKTDGMMACVHALSLDAGKRAADALAAIPKE